MLPSCSSMSVVWVFHYLTSDWIILTWVESRDSNASTILGKNGFNPRIIKVNLKSLLQIIARSFFRSVIVEPRTLCDADDRFLNLAAPSHPRHLSSSRSSAREPRKDRKRPWFIYVRESGLVFLFFFFPIITFHHANTHTHTHSLCASVAKWSVRPPVVMGWTSQTAHICKLNTHTHAQTNTDFFFFCRYFEIFVRFCGALVFGLMLVLLKLPPISRTLENVVRDTARHCTFLLQYIHVETKKLLLVLCLTLVWFHSPLALASLWCSTFSQSADSKLEPYWNF